MTSFFAVFSVVIAVFGIITIGYVAGRTRYLSEAAAQGIADFAFRVAIPALLFHTIVTAKLDGVLFLGVIASFFGAVAVTWALSIVATAVLLRRPAHDQPSIAMTSTFGNTVMLGLPIGVSVLGPEALAPMSAIVACHSPLLLLSATLHAAVADGEDRQKEGRQTSVGAAILDVLRQLATQPLVLAIAAAVVCRVLAVPLPGPVLGMAEMLSRAGVPAALISLGLSLATFKIGGNRPTLAVQLILKLVAMPLVATGFAIVLGLPPLSMAVVVLMAALPAGANAYLFASQRGFALHSASSAVAVGTAISALTLSLVLTLLQAFVVRPS